MKEILEALVDALAFWRHPKDEREELSDPTKGFRFQLLYGKDLWLWYGFWAFVWVCMSFAISYDQLPEWAKACGILLTVIVPLFLWTAGLFWFLFGSSLKWLVKVLLESLMFWRN